jgi:hypothetical protein
MEEFMIESDICFCIIFNHRYDKNIDKLLEIYMNRFHNIYFIIPFYDGNLENCIPVYENSFQFQGYIAQAYHHIYNERFSHYVFIADDLILNPKINEKNILEYLNLQSNSSYIEGFIELHKKKQYWARVEQAINLYKSSKGTEFKNELPSYHNAIQCFNRHQLNIQPLSSTNIYGRFELSKVCLKSLPKRLKVLLKKTKLPYPIVGAYSDFIVISKDDLYQFSKYCGVFAAMNLFVELAIPTSMVLACDSITTLENTNLYSKPLWTKKEVENLEQQNHLSIDTLFENFPENCLYYHPIKLSKWK